MKILIVTQNFYPENFKINDLCLELTKRGHELTILTGKPNYPKGKFYEGYTFFSKHNEYYHGAKVIRVPVFPRGKGLGIELFLNYISFAFFGSIFAFFHNKRYNFSFVFSVSPITAAIPGIIHKIIYGTKLVLWVQDLWPESVEVTGRLKSNNIKKYLLNLVKFIYGKSDEIFISSMLMKESISEKLDPNKNIDIKYMPNWAEDTFYHNVSDPKKYQNIMPYGFKIMFAGNIGSGQDISSILKAASKLKNNSNIKIIFVGDGSLKNYLIDQIANLKLKKIVYYVGSFPIEEMVHLYCHADMMLLSLRNELIYSHTVPGKFQSYLASKNPVIAMINGEVSRIIKKSGCGIVVNAGDYNALASELIKLSTLETSSFDEMGENGFNYYQNNFKKNNIVDYFLQSLNSYE